MSLYTDGPIITADTLQAIDSSVMDVSAAQKISLSGPSGVILQAWTELGHELREWLDSVTGDVYPTSSLIVQTGLFVSNRGRFLLNQVVTTWQFAGMLSPLGQYAAHKALTSFWQQATRSSKTADRFEKRYEMADKDRREAKRRFWAAGIPVVLNPLSCPGAQFDRLAGIWSNTNLAVGPTPTNLPETAYDVAITWVDNTAYLSPSNNGNGESGPSSVISILIPPNCSLQVNILSLYPPGTIPYQGGIADGVHFARNASGWNVYANFAGQPLILQNTSPLPLSQTLFEMTAIRTAGNLVTAGQVPDSNQPPTRSFSRA